VEEVEGYLWMQRQWLGAAGEDGGGRRRRRRGGEQCGNGVWCVLESTMLDEASTMSPVTVGTELPSYFLTTSYRLPNDFPDFTSFV
jgi:hypothetical protein